MNHVCCFSDENEWARDLRMRCVVYLLSSRSDKDCHYIQCPFIPPSHSFSCCMNSQDLRSQCTHAHTHGPCSQVGIWTAEFMYMTLLSLILEKIFRHIELLFRNRKTPQYEWCWCEKWLHTSNIGVFLCRRLWKGWFFLQKSCHLMCRWIKQCGGLTQHI